MQQARDLYNNLFSASLFCLHVEMLETSDQSRSIEGKKSKRFNIALMENTTRYTL